MSRVFVTKQFDRFLKSAELEDGDLVDAVEAADRGITAAQLGGGLVKLRVARPGGGKSGGYRTIVAYREGDKSFFIEGFAKNEQDNLPRHVVNDLRQYGKLLQTQNETALNILKATGAIREIRNHE